MNEYKVKAKELNTFITQMSNKYYFIYKSNFSRVCFTQNDWDELIWHSQSNKKN